MADAKKYEQVSIPIPDQPAGAVRIRARINHADNRYSKLQVWLNGDLITGEHALVIRNADFMHLILRLKPEIIIVDRENISDDLWKRIKHVPEVELI